MWIEEIESIPPIWRLFPKAVLNSVLIRKAPTLPQRGLRLNRIQVNHRNLTAYGAVCAFNSTAILPITYPHILAFPLHLSLMTMEQFPFPLLGLVHIGNRIQQFRRIHRDSLLDLECFFGEAQAHDKGTCFNIHTQVYLDGEIVWSSQSSMLYRHNTHKLQTKSESKKTQPIPESHERWMIDPSLGWRYARISGDFNPIHIHPWFARLFGFPRSIAHGMWSKARCLAALDKQLPSAYTVDVQFKLPILLPAEVVFSHQVLSDTQEFYVQNAINGKPHLHGLIQVP